MNKADDDSMDKMRAAVFARAADLGLEKSKISADYIQKKQQAAMAAGSARAASENGEMFGGLDLSKIRNEAPSRNSIWAEDNEEIPSMFFDPDEELTEEERAQVDPVGTKSIPDQFMYEMQQTTWPGPGNALREVGIMIVVVAISAVLIIEWDKLLRFFYTEILHFIPSTEDMANYANRFAGLDLPAGWTDNMNENDIASFSDVVGDAGGASTTTTITGGGLPKF